MDKINIFKPGKHTASNGETSEFSEDNIRATIEAYDPAIHEAPIVVGHPKDNGPAYGWISTLNYSEDGIEADAIQVDPEFSEMVQAGRFKKRSASFYHPDSPNNPVPGVYYLRHVGFLGAQAPAIKGLRDISFSEEDEGVVEFMDDNMTASIFRRMRDFFIERFGLDAADKVLPDHLVSTIEDDARRQNDEQTIPSFTEESEMTPEQIAELQDKAARADALESENEQLKTQAHNFSEREEKIKRQEVGAEIQALVDQGKVLPAKKLAIVDFMMSLDQAGLTVDFSEEGMESQPQRDFMMDFLKAQPAKVDFKEHDQETDVTQDMTAQELADKALEFQESEKQHGRIISATQAVEAVRTGKASKKEG